MEHELPLGDHNWEQILGSNLPPGGEVVKVVATFFDKEADAMVGRLLKQNKNNNKLLTDQITALSTINKTLRDSLLKRYITRCKITHSLAFFQWRAKHVPRANRDELVEVFEEKIQKTIQFIEEATKKRKHKVVLDQKRAAQQA